MICICFTNITCHMSLACSLSSKAPTEQRRQIWTLRVLRFSGNCCRRGWSLCPLWDIGTAPVVGHRLRPWGVNDQDLVVL